MPDRIRIDRLEAIPAGELRQYQLPGGGVIVARSDQGLTAFRDECPHAGQTLGAADGGDGVITCSRHGWQFDLKSGASRIPGRPGLRMLDVFVTDDEVFVELDEPDEQPAAHVYLVRYGAAGWVEYFGSDEAVQGDHRCRLLLETRRGQEVGELLSPATPVDGSMPQPSGRIIRILNPEELPAAADTLTLDLVETCQKWCEAENRPLDVIDGELLFDGQTSVLYFLGEPFPELDRWEQLLSARAGRRVVLDSFDGGPARQAGCGSGGCGSGGCGSGGGCGTDQDVTAAAEEADG